MVNEVGCLPRSREFDWTLQLRAEKLVMKALNLTFNKQGREGRDASMADSIAPVSPVYSPDSEHARENKTKHNVTVEQVNPPLGNFSSACGHLSKQEGDATGMLQAVPESYLPGYGPECIAEETEVVAAEINTPTVSSTDQTSESIAMSDSHCQNNSHSVPSSNVSENNRNVEAQTPNSSHITMMDPSDKDAEATSPNAEQDSLSDQSSFMLGLNRDKALNITPLVMTPGQTLAWMKREWKKARDRAKKRSKRADPLYRTKERAEALVRMRNRRSDPEYRERERARDRQRRRLARQRNLMQRQEERARDRIYKQRRRTSLMQDPQLASASGNVSSEYVDTEDLSQNVSEMETSRGSSILECTSDLDFQVVEVYNEMEVKVEQCVEAYS